MAGSRPEHRPKASKTGLQLAVSTAGFGSGNFLFFGPTSCGRTPTLRVVPGLGTQAGGRRVLRGVEPLSDAIDTAIDGYQRAAISELAAELYG